MDNNRNKNFSYTYSAKEQAEVKRIREKYTPAEKTQDKMEYLRKLDASVTKKGTVISIILGIIGSLIMGCGMSLAMTELGTLLGEYAMLIGIGVGIVGIALVALAYPVYTGVTKKERERVAPEIIRLTDELMK
jgi:hypothetical protein